MLLYTPVNEHFGIVPVEAMHAGLPVLASNTGGPLETVVDGETGWLRDAHDVGAWTDVMRKVLVEMDESERGRMAAKARERVEREFSLTAMGDRLEEEIVDMLGKPRRPFTVLGLQELLVGVLVSGIAVSVLVAVALRAL